MAITCGKTEDWPDKNTIEIERAVGGCVNKAPRPTWHIEKGIKKMAAEDLSAKSMPVRPSERIITLDLLRGSAIPAIRV